MFVYRLCDIFIVFAKVKRSQKPRIFTKGLNAGIDYWYALSDNVVVSPMLQLNDLSGDLGIGTVVSFQVKL